MWLSVDKDNAWLVLSRKVWEMEGIRLKGFDFSKEELDTAESSEDGLIGSRMGIECYLESKMKFTVTQP